MFRFKQFTIQQDRCAMKVTTDGCLFGAFVASLESLVASRNTKEVNALDIGAGTGLLSLMLAQKNPDIRIDAIEIDPDAAEQANENVGVSPWKDRINIINADIRKIPETFSQYDIIISNPPFHENQLSSDDQTKNKAHHSSELSLDEVLTIIGKTLNDEGRFYLLLPYYRLEEIKSKIKESGYNISKLVLIKQSYSHDFFRIIIEGNIQKENDAKISELSIWNEKQEYTPQFIELLKDYYLYL